MHGPQISKLNTRTFRHLKKKTGDGFGLIEIKNRADVKEDIFAF